MDKTDSKEVKELGNMNGNKLSAHSESSSGKAVEGLDTMGSNNKDPTVKDYSIIVPYYRRPSYMCAGECFISVLFVLLTGELRFHAMQLLPIQQFIFIHIFTPALFVYEFTHRYKCVLHSSTT
jgi:hypothetical protein